MSDVQDILIDDARRALLREISPVSGRDDLQEAFAAWLLGDDVPGVGMAGPVDASVKASGAERSYRHVAVLGLAAHVGGLDPEGRVALASGLDWMVRREPVVGLTPMPFCLDGVGLAALALGAKSLGDSAQWEETCRWMRRCRAATATGQGLGIWQEWLLAIVGSHLGLDWDRNGGEGPGAAEVRVALRSVGFGANDPATSIEADEREVLDIVRSESPAGLGVPRAAIRLAALSWVRRARPLADLRNVSVAEVCDLLRGATSGLKKWTWESKPRTKTSPEPRKWHVDNEYHVQNLLWLILAPIFPDLNDEDATPKVGPVQPRADIGIPSLRAIVEAKFMRSSDAPKDMIEQIAEDASLYLVPGSRYETVIPFIWDDSRRTEHHAEMVRGLRQIAGVADAVIISRPGSMQGDGTPGVLKTEAGSKPDAPKKGQKSEIEPS